MSWVLLRTMNNFSSTRLESFSHLVVYFHSCSTSFKDVLLFRRNLKPLISTKGRALCMLHSYKLFRNDSSIASRHETRYNWVNLNWNLFIVFLAQPSFAGRRSRCEFWSVLTRNGEFFNWLFFHQKCRFKANKNHSNHLNVVPKGDSSDPGLAEDKENNTER